MTESKKRDVFALLTLFLSGLLSFAFTVTYIRNLDSTNLSLYYLVLSVNSVVSTLINLATPIVFLHHYEKITQRKQGFFTIVDKSTYQLLYYSLAIFILAIICYQSFKLIPYSILLPILFTSLMAPFTIGIAISTGVLQFLGKNSSITILSLIVPIFQLMIFYLGRYFHYSTINLLLSSSFVSNFIFFVILSRMRMRHYFPLSLVSLYKSKVFFSLLFFWGAAYSDIYIARFHLNSFDLAQYSAGAAVGRFFLIIAFFLSVAFSSRIQQSNSFISYHLIIRYSVFFFIISLTGCLFLSTAPASIFNMIFGDHLGDLRFLISIHIIISYSLGQSLMILYFFIRLNMNTAVNRLMVVCITIPMIIHLITILFGNFLGASILVYMLLGLISIFLLFKIRASENQYV